MRSQGLNKQFKTDIIYQWLMIAPCGMNCGSCIAYMRTKNNCPGCWFVDECKTRVNCIVRNCDLLKKTGSGFCFDCPKYPCQRLKSLEKRYRTKYNTSFFENLSMIKESGIKYFLDFETRRRTCPACGARLSVHRNSCLACGNQVPEENAPTDG